MVNGVTVAPGGNDYTSSGTIGFVPEIWAGKLAPKFYENSVYPYIANTDYEGEIKAQGSVVQVRVRPDIIVRDYIQDGGLQVQRPKSTKISLIINKAKYFNISHNDILRTQSDINLLNEFTDDAAEQVVTVVDQDVLNTVYADFAATNKGLTAGKKSASYDLGTTSDPVDLTSANIMKYITALGAVLDEAKVPMVGRWLCAPAWFCFLIKNSDLKKANEAGDATSIARNGLVGIIDRFKLYMTNNVNSVADGAETTWHVMAGHSAGLTFAAQILPGSVETLRNPDDFGDLLRGLTVYGYKVINADLLADLYCKNAETM